MGYRIYFQYGNLKHCEQVEIELTLMAGIPKKIYITKDGAL